MTEQQHNKDCTETDQNTKHSAFVFQIFLEDASALEFQESVNLSNNNSLAMHQGPGCGMQCDATHAIRNP